MSDNKEPESGQRETATVIESKEGALTGSAGQRGLDTVPNASTPSPTKPETIVTLLTSTGEAEPGK